MSIDDGFNLFQQLAYSTLSLSYWFKFQYLPTAPKAHSSKAIHFLLAELCGYMWIQPTSKSMRCNFVRFLLAVKLGGPKEVALHDTDLEASRMSFSKVVATIPSLEGIHLGLQQDNH